MCFKPEIHSICHCEQSNSQQNLTVVEANKGKKVKSFEFLSRR
jgi:hypothetical protein